MAMIEHFRSNAASEGQSFTQRLPLVARFYHSRRCINATAVEAEADIAPASPIFAIDPQRTLGGNSCGARAGTASRDGR
jgi:hypothetical protein